MAFLPNIEDLELQTNETIVAEWMVDHMQDGHWKRGKLILTNERLAFQPTNAGIALGTLGVLGGTGTPNLGGETWATTRSNLVGIAAADEVTDKTFEKGRHVDIKMKSGDPQQFFLLSDLEKGHNTLKTAVP